MAVNGTIAKTSFTDSSISSSLKVKSVHITELRTAITRLQGYAVNVDNCGNCTYCQTCQTATCQGVTCQSKSCQSLSCQICQVYDGNYSCQEMECNCDCGDDS